MTVELLGATATRRDLALIAKRALDPREALEAEERALESRERALFSSLGGRFVRTGRTERSLTDASGPDAIREIHGTTLTFGTAVPYAIFLRDHGHPGVLAQLTPSDATQAAVLLGRSIMAGIGE